MGGAPREITAMANAPARVSAPATSSCTARPPHASSRARVGLGKRSVDANAASHHARSIAGSAVGCFGPSINGSAPPSRQRGCCH
jgi:hypothetical protein